MSMAQLSQKEYLKKYLSANSDDKKKKKKKKVQKSGQERFRIVDDDIDLKNMRPIENDELDLYNLAEDAPQIAGIIDERPHEAQMLEEFRGSKRWKIVTDENGTDEIKVTAITGTSKKPMHLLEDTEDPPFGTAMLSISDNSPLRKSKKDSDASPPRKFKKYSDSDPDLSPPRKSRKNSDLSPPRKSRRNSNSDISPPQRSTNASDSDLSPPRKLRRGSDSDISPQRKSRTDSVEKVPARKSANPNLSPSRKSRKASEQNTLTSRSDRKGTDSDFSPPRKHSRYSSPDISPPRKPKGNYISPSKSKGQRYTSLHRRKRNDSPRRSRFNSSESNKYRKSETFTGKRTNSTRQSPFSRRRRSDSDNSPPRKSLRKSISPPWKQKPRYRASDHSPPSKMRRDDPTKSQRQSESPIRSNRRNGRSSSDNSPFRKGRMDKTLDGKRAGLQDANELKQELSDFRRREDELFSKMGDEVSGRGAAAIIRDRRTGKQRDFVEEAKRNEEEQRKKDIRNEKYSKWGRGLKQVEAQKENLQQALHEMSKPLARYADDQDLEKHLRDQEREGDPMLDYIRSKKTEDSTKKKQKYEGSFLPNRFGILPGHRWDGVDRSNGYEKQWFQTQNAKKAHEEEAYKWSTSDM